MYVRSVKNIVGLRKFFESQKFSNTFTPPLQCLQKENGIISKKYLKKDKSFY